MKTLIVMPIGVSEEGTPIQSLLEASVNSLLSQTDKNFTVIVAADENVPQRCLDFLTSKKIEVIFFESFSWFRKGSSWKKVTDIWKSREYDNVAFCHYDDIWDENKLKFQHELMSLENLNGSWSESYIIDVHGNVTSGDLSFNELTIHTLGTRTSAFAHSCIVNRQAILNSGFFAHENDWAGNFEDLWSLYMHKLRSVKKCINAKIFWRNHSMNMTTTHVENIGYVATQRAITNYTLTETMNDAQFINELIKEEKNNW